MSQKNKKINIIILSSILFPLVIYFLNTEFAIDYLSTYGIYFIPLLFCFFYLAWKSNFENDAINILWGIFALITVYFFYKQLKTSIGIFYFVSIPIVFIFGKFLKRSIDKKVKEFIGPQNNQLEQENHYIDFPIHTKNADQFGFAEGAKKVANLVQNKKLATFGAYVIGISGSWGSGKSSFINLILEEITFNGDQKIEQIKLFPWFSCKKFSMEEQFINSLSKKGFFCNAELKQIFYNYSKALDIIFPNSGETFLKICLFNNENDDIDKIQNDISDILIRTDTKILVVIDDLDRLTTEEIFNVFQLVKATANFKNIIYILGYDPEQVNRIMKNSDSSAGQDKLWSEAYLEKIFQKRITVPMIPKRNLMENFHTKIKIIMKNSELEIEKKRWDQVINSGFEELFQTPRDVNRYLDQFQFYYNNFHDNINIIDIIVITGLLNRFPGIEQQIYNYEQILTYSKASKFLSISEKEKLVAEFYSEVPKLAHKLLQEIFPLLLEINSLNEKINIPRSKMYLCYRERFETFFRQFHLEGSFSEKEMKLFLAIASQKSCEIARNEIENNKRSENEAIIEFVESFGDCVPSIDSLDAGKWFKFWLINYMTIPTRYPYYWMESDSQTYLQSILLKIINFQKYSRKEIIRLFNEASEEILTKNGNLKMLFLESFLSIIVILMSDLLRDENIDKTENMKFKESVQKIYFEIFDQIVWSGAGLSFFLIDGRTFFNTENETTLYIENNLSDIKLCIDLISGCYTDVWGAGYSQTLQKPFLNGKFPLEKMYSRISEILKDDEEKRSSDFSDKNLLTDYETRKANFFLKLAEARLNGTEEF